MTLSRRKFITILGGGTILAAGGSAAAFLGTRTPHKAIAPWDRAGDYSEPRRRALSYAILAPNPHNRQPWLVDLSTENQVIIFRDKAKDLPHTDPYSRQLTIGMGCFLEQLKIAASDTGHNVEFDLFSKGEDGPVAIATFLRGATPDPLFGHVLARRSCKEPYQEKPVPQELASQLAGDATIIIDPDQVATLRDLTWQAFQVEYHTPRTLKESVDLFRLGKAEINANPDGIDLGGPFLESLIVTGMLTRQAAMEPDSAGYAEGLRMYHELLSATPAYAVLTSPSNALEDQIAAGRRWLRLNLTTTALGLALHPVSQALQEYPEMKTHYDRAHALLAKPGETVQMLGRLGYGPEVSPSPRWPLEAKVVNG